MLVENFVILKLAEKTYKEIENTTVATTEKIVNSSSSSQQNNNNGNSNNFTLYNNQNQQNTKSYVLNTSTKKIHYSSCRDVPKIKSENYSTTTDLEGTLNQGYTKCGHCFK